MFPTRFLTFHLRSVALASLALPAACGDAGNPNSDTVDAAPSNDAPDNPGFSVSFEPAWTLVGTSPSGVVGLTVASVGDVNRDGGVDFAVTDWSSNHVRVHNGKTSALLYELAPANATANTFGRSISTLGDLDGDAVPDYAVSAPDANSGAGRVTLHSGASGAVFRTVDGTITTPFERVAGLGDVNGDGFADLAIGARSATRASIADAGAVVVLSGKDASVLASVDGWVNSDEGAFLGSDVASAGDLDGDGRADVVAGAQFDGAGSAHVFSTANGAKLRSVTPPGSAASLGFGFSVGGGADVDGDSKPDIIVGCAQCSPNSKDDSGYAAVYSGASGQRIFDAGGEQVADVYGSSVDLIADLDGDGRAEWIVSGPANGVLGGPPRPGYLEIRSSRAGGVLVRLEGSEPLVAFGASFAVADFSGDGLPDLVVGAPGAAAYAGEVKLFVQQRTTSVE